jgi:hypothetical protein
MADDSAQSSPLDDLLRQLADAPDIVRPDRQRATVIDWNNDVLAVVGPWLDDLLSDVKACAALIKTPSPGEGIDSAWLRRFCDYLKGLENVRRNEGLTEALNQYLDDLGMQAVEYHRIAYHVGKFRRSHTAGGIAGLLEDDEQDLFAQLRVVATRYEKHWIDSGLPPREGNGSFHKVTRHTPQQNELEQAIYRFEEEAGGLVLRITDQCLIPDELRRDRGFADAVFQVFKGGGCYPGVLFKRLCVEWLPSQKPGYGGEDWLYPGCREDDAKRFNQGVRFARCAAALADALQGVGSKTESAPGPLPVTSPAPAIFQWDDVLLAKDFDVEAFNSPHAKFARELLSVAHYLETEAEKGPTLTRKVESEDGLSASYPHREGDDPFPDTKESIAKCRASLDDCPQNVRQDVRDALTEAMGFASTRNKASIASSMADIHRLAIRLRTIGHRVFDEGQAASIEPAASSAGASHAESLRELAAAVAAKRESDAAAEARATERRDEYYRPYDAVWRDLVRADCNPVAGEPLDPSWLLDTLTTLVALARKMDAFEGKTLAIDRLSWLPSSPPAVENPITKAFALAIAAAVDGSLDLDGAAAVCGMLELHPGNELNALYRAYPEGDDSPRFELVGRPSNGELTEKPKTPDPISGFSAHALVAQFGGSLGENEWAKGVPLPGPASELPAHERVGTVAWLISELGVAEWYAQRAADFGAKITKAVTKGSIEEHYRNKQREEAQERDKHKSAIRKASGVEELQQWLNYHDIPWTQAGVEKQRDRLFVEQGTSRTEANALTLGEFLGRLRGQNVEVPNKTPSPPLKAAAVVKPLPSAITTLDGLQAAIPILDKADGKTWAKVSDLKSGFGESASETTLRTQRSKGVKNTAETFGVCITCRIWRKDDGLVWYYVPSLRSRRKDDDPLMIAARTLLSTVD